MNQQINEHWQALQQVTDPYKKLIKSVEMAKLLLENIDLNEDWSQYDQGNLTDIFLIYQETGQKICEFYNGALPHFIAEDKGEEEFKKQLKILKEQISCAMSESTRIIEQYRIWRNEQQNLEVEITKLEELKIIANNLERNITKLQETFVGLQPQLIRLTELGQESENLHEKINDVLTVAIPKVVNLLQDNYELYSQHFQENKRIADAINDMNNKLIELSSACENGKEIGVISRSISEQLLRLDQLLAGFIESSEYNREKTRAQ